jgi:8-oxo-dGTP pyrophosphatase MutT (NUDIX family)
MNNIPILAGICIFHKGKLLLLKCVQDGYDNDKWGPPGGHGEKGETALETAIRETKEEANLVVKVSGIVRIIKVVISDGSQLLFVFFSAEIDDISDLKIDHKESSDYAWVGYDDIESGRYNIRSEALLKPVLIRALKEKPLSLDVFVETNFTKPA